MHGKWVMPLVVIVLAFGATAYALYNRYPSGGTPVACPMDAKICSDGSAVGRVPPKCNFAPCPVSAATSTVSTDTATSTIACTPDECPFEIHLSDSGRSFTYALTSRFTVFLDNTDHPQSELSCSPEGILGPISNIPPAPAGMYAARFEGVAPGSCTLSDRDFHVTINIVASPVEGAIATSSATSTATTAPDASNH